MKKLLTLTLAVMMAVSFYVPFTTEYASAASTFAVRTSMPDYNSAAGKAYYYTNNNIFYKVGLAPTRKTLTPFSKVYCRGNCTWYAYARASEILGHNLNSNFRWSASKWWSTNKSKKIYPYGSTPKPGSIACYSSHVAIVEKVENGKVYFSESGWRTTKTRPDKASSLCFSYSTKAWGKGLKGYIYFTDATPSNTTVQDSESATAPTAAENIAKPTSSVNYNIKITATKLYQRTGPGSKYAAKGYIKPGTYTVVAESGLWQKLSNGYWVYSQYTSKVTQTTATQATTTQQTQTTATQAATTQQTQQTTTAQPTQTTQTSTAASSTGIRYQITSNVNVRASASTSSAVKTLAKKGSTFNIKYVKNGWGQISETGYWINLEHGNLSGLNVKITATQVNLRSGAGTKYKSAGKAKPGTYGVSAVKGDWYKLSSNGRWVSKNYATVQ